MKYIYILLIVCCTITIKTQAQYAVTGKILSTKNETKLPHANIYIADLKTGAVADVEGAFSLNNLPKGEWLLEVKLPNYETQFVTIKIPNQSPIEIHLKPTIVEIDEIVVTGVPKAAKRSTNPSPITTLNAQYFKENSANNVVEAIASVPGVNMIWEGPSIAKPIIRGLGYNNVVVVNDGIRQEGNQWGDEFGIEINDNTLEKVEIIKGPASLYYGSDALAGVINLIAAPTAPEGTANGTLITNYNTNNGLKNLAIKANGNKKGFIWDMVISTKAAHAYKNKFDGYVFNSGFTENDLKGTIGLQRKWGFTQLTVSSFQMKTGIIEGGRDSATGAFNQHIVSSLNEDSTMIVPNGQYKKYHDFPIIHQLIQHHKIVLDNKLIVGAGTINLTLGLQDNHRKEANDAVIGDFYNNYFHLISGNYNLSYSFNQHHQFEFTMGTNGMLQKSEDLGLVYLIPEFTSKDRGYYLMAKKYFKNLAISGGVRYDNRWIKTKNLWTDTLGERIENPQPITAIQRFKSFESNFNGFSGSLGLTYDFTKSSYFKINVSRGFRAPNIAECGSDGMHDGTPFYEIGDPNLKAQQSMQLDGTVGIKKSNFLLEANLFYNQINNYIFTSKLSSVLGGDSLRNDIALHTTDAPTYKFIQGNAVLSGAELMLAYSPQKLSWLQINYALSMVNGQLKNQPDSSKYLPYITPMRNLIVIRFRQINATKLFKNSYFKLDFDINSKQDKVYYKFNTESPTTCYSLINLGLGTDIQLRNKTAFSLILNMNNVTDIAYQMSISKLKNADVNNVTGRQGVYNMGRNISFKLIIPFE